PCRSRSAGLYPREAYCTAGKYRRSFGRCRHARSFSCHRLKAARESEHYFYFYRYDGSSARYGPDVVFAPGERFDRDGNGNVSSVRYLPYCPHGSRFGQERAPDRIQRFDTKDMPPEIVLLEPTDRADLPNNLRLDMLAHIRDDYGFRGVRLGYRISKSKYLKVDSNYTWATVPIPNPNAQEEDVPYIWNLTPLSIGPEDEVSYVMEVTDNDA